MILVFRYCQHLSQSTITLDTLDSMDFVEDIQKLKAARQNQDIASSPVTLMQNGVDFWRVTCMPLLRCSFLYPEEDLLTWG